MRKSRPKKSNFSQKKTMLGKQEEEDFNPTKMLRRRRFLRKSMANFHFDQVLSSRKRESMTNTTSSPKIRTKSTLFWSFTNRNQSSNSNKRVETKREQNLKKATPWLERVAAMRYFNLGKDHPRTVKIIQHLHTCYQETRRYEDERELTKNPSKYLYNLRLDLRAVHDTSTKPFFAREVKKVQKKEEARGESTVQSSREDNIDVESDGKNTNRPQSNRTTSQDTPFMTTKFQDLLRRSRDRRAISSHDKLRRTPVGNYSKGTRLRPISRWEYFDITKEHSQSIHERRGTLSETVLPALVRNIAKTRERRIIPEPTITRKKCQDDKYSKIDIDLSHFSLGNERMNLLFDVLEEDGDLVERLDLSSNRLVSSHLERIGKFMPNLRVLNMSRNRMEDVNRFFKNPFTHLRSLSLSSCNLDDKSVIHILSIQKHISILNLSSNHIGLKGALAVAKLMDTSKYLRSLDLSSNSLSVGLFLSLLLSFPLTHVKSLSRYKYR